MNYEETNDITVVLDEYERHNVPWRFKIILMINVVDLVADFMQDMTKFIIKHGYF